MRKHIVLMNEGMEVVGRVKDEDEYRILVEHPVFLIELFKMNPEPIYTWHGKNNLVNFNRSCTGYDYEPTPIIIEMYEAYVRNENYLAMAEKTNTILRKQVEALKSMKMSADVEAAEDDMPTSISDIMMQARKKAKLN